MYTLTNIFRCPPVPTFPGVGGMGPVISLLATVSVFWMPEKREKAGMSLRAFWQHMKRVLSMFTNKPFMKMALLKFLYNINVGLGAVMNYW